MKRERQRKRAAKMLALEKKHSGKYHARIWSYAMSRILSRGHWFALRQGRSELSELTWHRFCGWRYYGDMDFQLLRQDIRRAEKMLDIQLPHGMAEAIALKKKVRKEMKFSMDMNLGWTRQMTLRMRQGMERGLPIYTRVFDSDVSWFMQVRRRPKNRYKHRWFEERQGKRWKEDYCDEAKYRKVEQFLYQRHKRMSDQLHEERPWLYAGTCRPIGSDGQG